jgi:bifunctional DNA-binding transcriptional regulator/antitoxin component of YhaV-PrlF toxin-antitoxin module
MIVYPQKEEPLMGYTSTMQMIRRTGNTRQYYLICPASLAEALEIEKGESFEWVVEDKNTLILKRIQPKKMRVRA